MKVQVLSTCEDLTGGEVYVSAGEVISAIMSKFIHNLFAPTTNRTGVLV